MANRIKLRKSQDRPLVPLYYDRLACYICGADGHDARACSTPLPSSSASAHRKRNWLDVLWGR